MTRSFESAMAEWHDSPSFVVFVILASAIVSQTIFGILGLPFGLPDISTVMSSVRFPNTESLSHLMDHLGPIFDRVAQLVDRVRSL